MSLRKPAEIAPHAIEHARDIEDMVSRQHGGKIKLNYAELQMRNLRNVHLEFFGTDRSDPEFRSSLWIVEIGLDGDLLREIQDDDGE